jgi:ketosteroid isomerase-like protein
MLCGLAVSSKAQNAEKLIRTYLQGFEKKDWNMVASQFADDFTFTSPAGDDHISLAMYKERCFPTSQFCKKVEFSKIVVQGNCAFAIYNITTTDDKIVHNTEYYTFNKGKIRSIECFFGAGIGYPGSTKKFN